MKRILLKITFVSLISLVVAMSVVDAKTIEKHPVLISKYTFSKSDLKVGQVYLKGKEIKSVKILGEDAKSFSVDKSFNIWAKSYSGDIKYSIIVNVKDKEGKSYNQYFTLVKDEFLRNKVIAHRGAFKTDKLPENSIASLKKAIALGCEGSEFDVQLSKDSVYFVNHDPHYKKVIIEENLSVDIAKLKLNNGETLPLLKDYLQAGLSQNKTKLILEIKPTKKGEERVDLLVKKVLEEVAENQAQAWVEYISFDIKVCEALLKYNPFCKVSYLEANKTPQEIKNAGFYGIDYHYNAFKKNPEWIKQSLELGLAVNVWTVNDKETIKWLLDQNVTFITTNEPELMLDLIKK